MEKLIYALWRREECPVDDFRDQLLGHLDPHRLAEAQVRAGRIAVADGDVAAASDKRLSTCQELPDALLSLWFDYAGARAAIEVDLAAIVDRFTVYLVTEAEPLVNERYRAGAGERLFGFCQVVFLRRPTRLSEAEWLLLWQGSHTPLAIETQSTFGYRQNVIVRALSADAPAFDAIVEENFPPAAMSSDLAFYGVNDQAGLQANQTAMMESCARFIDFDKIDVIPMSEYVLKSRGE